MLIITCSACSGGDPDCSACGGSGEEPIYRCPASFNDPAAALFFLAYAQFTEHGVMPESGSLMEQSASFVRLCREVDAERAKLEREAAQ